MCDMCDMSDKVPAVLEIRGNATAAELWSESEKLGRLTNEVSLRADDKRRQWQNAANPRIKDALWKEYHQLHRDYEVIAAWKNLYYSVYIFHVLGADSSYMGDSFVRQSGMGRSAE